MEQAEQWAPVLRAGLQFRPLANDMVFVYHPNVATQIMEARVGAALQLCRGQLLSEMLPEVRTVMDYDCTLEEWTNFLGRMAQCGLFEGTRNLTPRVHLFDPTAVMNFLTEKCRWLFTSTTVVVLFLLLFAGLWELLSHWGRFAGDVMHYTAIHPFLSAFLFYFCFLPIGLLHELAHGVVCRWQGGEAVEVGLKKDSANLYVYTSLSALTTAHARILYLAGGVLQDMFIFFVLVNLWLVWPNYVTFMFLLPQALFVLQFSYAMEEGSDLSQIVREWTDIDESGGRWAFLKEFFSSRPKTAVAWKRAAIYLGSIALQTAVAALLIWSFRQPVPVSFWRGFQLHIPFWPPLLYLIYRGLRYGLMNLSRLRPASR